MSFYVAAVARNYNILIGIQATGTPTARFRTQLEKCNTRAYNVDCDIIITYDWSDNTPGSGTSTATIVSGSSTVFVTPSGYNLTYIEITGVDFSACTNYNSVGGCSNPFVTTTTTTTTTTTSTTTSTTTIAPAEYPQPVIKHDHYSSSWGAGGSNIWPNVGTGGSTYNLSGFEGQGAASIESLGTGVGKYLRVSGGQVQFGPTGDLILYGNPAFTGNFVSINNKSFSYAVVFRIQNENINSYNDISGFSVPYSDGEVFLTAGFSMHTERNLKLGQLQPQLFSGVYQYDAGYGPSGYVQISTTSRWYLAVFTYNKNASASLGLKLYLNNNKISFNDIDNDFNLATYFDNTAGKPVTHTIAWATTDLNIAAVAFWDDVILTDAQVQSIFNEYNSRYTLG